MPMLEIVKVGLGVLGYAPPHLYSMTYFEFTMAYVGHLEYAERSSKNDMCAMWYQGMLSQANLKKMSFDKWRSHVYHEEERVAKSMEDGRQAWLQWQRRKAEEAKQQKET